MLPVPTSDIMKIGILIAVLGAFVLAKNYFPISTEKASLEGRLQFGGNSFEIKNKIIAKYNAWVGFTLIVLSAIIQFISINLDKYTTFADLKGRTVLFGSWLNIITTISVFILLFRIIVFITDFGARREYFPFLQDRERNNFSNSVSRLKDARPEVASEAQRGIDQQILLFDIRIKKDLSYDKKVQKLREEVFK